MREFTQAGVELIGAEAPDGTAEVIEVLSAALDAVGLTRAVIGLGDADLYRQLLDELGRRGRAPRSHPRAARRRTTSSGLEAEVGELEIGAGERETLLRLPSLRGGPEVLDRARELGGAAVERATQRLAATYEALAARGVAERVSLDLGLLRDLGYYTGRDPRGLRPGARPRARRRRALRRADGPLRPTAAGGRASRSTWSACTSRRPRRSGWRRSAGVRRSGRTEVSGQRARASEGALKLAVPRGALFDGTLDLLDADRRRTPRELRGDSRSLVFEADGLVLVTMRPSDVPTYVEAGAADLGITGKDVLLEQRDRAVYELLDLGYGACRMVLAGAPGRREPGRGRAAPRVDADRDQVPAHRPSATSSRRAARRR